MGGGAGNLVGEGNRCSQLTNHVKSQTTVAATATAPSMQC
jgi:hypothetical protein